MPSGSFPLSPRGVGGEVHRWLSRLCILLLAPAAFAADLSLRVEDVGAPGATVRVSLIETCTSYACGRARLLREALPSSALAPYFEESVGEAGVVRLSTPEDRDAWWVVVEAGDSLPLALLWRPTTMHGYLPAAPRISKASCRVVVLDAYGEAISGAHVVPVIRDLPSELNPTRKDRPAVFLGWRPWLSPSRTDSTGRAILEVPAGASVDFHVAADGYRSAAAQCRPNGIIPLGLDPASMETFRLEDLEGRALPGALARDGLGMPVALGDAQGAIELDLATVEAADRSAARFWFETAIGAVYEPVELRTSDDAAVLVVSERSSPRLGVVNLQAVETVAGTEIAQAWTWREPNWPWPAVEPRAATPLLEIEGGAYAVVALPGERLWFAAPQAAHAVCEDPGRSARRADSRNETTCPTLEPAPRIDGVVLDEDGTPIPDAEIRIDWTAGPAGPTIVRDSGTRGGFGTALMRSDPNGQFGGRHVPLDTTTPGLDNSFSERRVRVERPPYLPIRDRRLEEFATDTGGYAITLVRGARIAGRVVDALTSEPVADADVAVGQFAGRGRRSVVLGPLHVATGRYGKHVRTARTDSGGAFELTTWPGRQDLVVRASGRAFFMQPGLAVLPLGQDLGDIKLDRQLQIWGIVLDPDGLPVPNATVWAAGSNTSGALSRPSTEASPRSGIAARFDPDRHGRFFVPGLSRESTVDLEISAPGFATQHRLEVSPTEAAAVEIVLEPEAVIAGRVTWHGQGIATQVDVFGEAGSNTSWSTDEEGRFQTTGLAQGQYNLVAYPPGAGTFVVVDDSKGPPVANRYTLLGDGPGEEKGIAVRADSGETVEVSLELGFGKRRLFGRVSERGAGLSGVAIRLERRGAMTVTDGDGRYAIEGLPSGLAWVTADRGAGFGEDTNVLRQTVDIDSESKRLDFDFSVFRVVGQVVLGNGSPAAGTEISFTRIGGGSPDSKRTMTRGDGSFDVDLAAGDYHVGAKVTHNRASQGDLQRRRLEARDIVRVAGDSSDVLVRLRHSLRLAGKVHGLSEGDLERLRLEAVRDDLTRHEAETIRGYPDQFLFHNLDSGRWTIVGRVGNSDRRAERQITLEERDARIDLTFEPLPTLSGVVTLDGQPLQGAHVLLIRGQNRASARRFWTRHDGTFHFPDLESGSYSVAVGAETRIVSVHGDSQRFIDLRSGGIEGAAHDAISSAPLAGAAVRLWPAWSDRQAAERFGIARTTFVDRQGQFEFDRLPAGAWTLEVEGIGGARHIRVGPNAVIQVTVP